MRRFRKLLDESSVNGLQLDLGLQTPEQATAVGQGWYKGGWPLAPQIVVIELGILTSLSRNGEQVELRGNPERILYTISCEIETCQRLGEVVEFGPLPEAISAQEAADLHNHLGDWGIMTRCVQLQVAAVATGREIVNFTDSTRLK